MSEQTVRLPELCEGWSWNVTRPVVDDHPKVRIELLLHGEVRRHGTIDVQMHGDTAAVVGRARAMVESVAAEQLAGLGGMR